MGPSPRGGAYTYDWIENLLRLNMHSVDHVLTEFQHPAVGDKIMLGTNQMRMARVEPRARARMELARRQLGLDVCHRGTGREVQAHQPQPLPAADAHRAYGHGSNGACLARDGSQNAAGDKGTRRTPRDRAVSATLAACDNARRVSVPCWLVERLSLAAADCPLDEIEDRARIDACEQNHEPRADIEPGGGLYS